MSKQDGANKKALSKKQEIDDTEENPIVEIEKAVTKINPKIFQGVQPDKKKEILSAVTVLAMKHHSGPIPSPETLQGYDNILPGAADRVITMAEKQQNHRMGLETKHLSEQMGQSRLGQWLGFIIAIIAISAGTYLTMNGHDTVGGILLGTTLVSLVAVFVVGKYNQKS